MEMNGNRKFHKPWSFKTPPVHTWYSSNPIYYYNLPHAFLFANVFRQTRKREFNL